MPLEQLPPRVDVALVLNPRLTSVELLATVCDELGVAYPAGTTSLKVLVDALDRHLLTAHGQGRRTLLIIDEAQNLAPRRSRRSGCSQPRDAAAKLSRSS